MIVNQQVKVPFSIGTYKDEVICHVVPMEAGHLLLGRPWQYDREVIHDGFKNRCSFVKDGKSVTLVPLTPKQVYEDQLKLKSEFEQKYKSEAKISKKKGPILLHTKCSKKKSSKELCLRILHKFWVQP